MTMDYVLNVILHKKKGVKVMKEYQMPEIEVLNLKVVDIITNDDENATSWG